MRDFRKVFSDRVGFTIDGHERSVKTYEDGSFTLAFTKNPLPRVEDSVAFRKKYTRFFEYGLIIKVDACGLFFGRYVTFFSVAGNRIFPKKEWRKTVFYKDGRITGRGENGASINECFWANVLRFIGRECIFEQRNDVCRDILASRMLENKTVLKGILDGRINNRKEAISAFMKSAYKVKRFSYETVEAYFNCRFFIPSLSQFIEFTTDWEEAVRRVKNACENADSQFDFHLFRDLLQDAFLLNIKVNPRWSRSRMEKEHQKNIERERLEEQASLDRESVYTVSVPKVQDGGVEGYVIDSEYLAYLESSAQHNCVYTHYFEAIRKGEYVALSLTRPERITVGLNACKADDGQVYLQFEQMKLAHNRDVGNKSRDIIMRYLEQKGDELSGLVGGGALRPRTRNAKYDDGLPF